MEFQANQSIYSQITDYVKRLIFSGVYGAGAKLPAIREFAVGLKVNPNTVARAYAELEAEGLIYTESTTGKFVTDDGEILKDKLTSYVRQLGAEFFDVAFEFGLSEEEALRILEENYAKKFSITAHLEIVREKPCLKRHIG